MIGDVFAAAEKNQIFDITLTGGETLLWENLGFAMEATRNLIFPSIALITNATVVSESRLRKIADGNVSRINVSLDGIGIDHDRNRGEGSFDRTIRGIEELKSVVDNITVISVLDKSNYDRWQRLTEMLVRLGVKQHHLTPVCYSGNAREDYNGMSLEQFQRVRAEVEAMQPNLPTDFKLRFGDTLINGFHSRELPIHLFVEGFKGWQVHVRPDGLVKGHTKVWGRNWRTDEVLGDLNHDSMGTILADYPNNVCGDVDNRYTMDEEAARKFHLTDDVDDVKAEDDADMERYADGSQPSGNDDLSESQFGNGTKVAEQLIEGMDFTEATAFESKLPQIQADPNRYRLRTEHDFGLLFDTETFDVVILTENETACLKDILG